MKLYHGTSYNKYKRILREGIKPKEDMVRLTNTYPFYYARCDDGRTHGVSVVFEIDLMNLKQDCLYPQEIFILAMLHRIGEKSISLGKDGIEEYKHYWIHCMNHIGSLTYSEKIEPMAIERACIVNWGLRKELAIEVMAPAISITNHKREGNHYRHMLKWFFGDTEMLPQVERTLGYTEMFGGENPEQKEFQKALEYWILMSNNRTGIKVCTFEKSNGKNM